MESGLALDTPITSELPGPILFDVRLLDCLSCVSVNNISEWAARNLDRSVGDLPCLESVFPRVRYLHPSQFRRQRNCYSPRHFCLAVVFSVERQQSWPPAVQSRP
jgi:hypothetical protein